MRRFRNPQYCLESLEKKLSPSGMGTVLVAAEVGSPVAHASNSDLPPYDPTVPPAPTNPPPEPGDPGGPTDPC